MNRQDRTEEPRTDPKTERPDPRERTSAPPIEREHETQEGALEEDEKRKQQKRE